jgi:ankyrin repeat protein
MLIHGIEPKLKLDNYGFNKLHLDVLKLSELTEKYHTASITKKAANWNVTPLHLAALNPSAKVMQTLLDQNNDFNVVDNQNNKPIHYAACCETPGALKILLERGANVFESNMQKKNPLHFAALNSRPENVKLLLENNLMMLKMRDRQNKTAFVYALESGDIPTIKSFLDNSQGKVKINTGQGIERMTPLMYAAAQGDIELAEFLLDNKARVLGKDKYKRSALTMAARNGHLRLASILLQQGSEWDHQDSSNNTPLHYAAANGFIELINLLIKHGANVNHQNSWKVTPITIAMLNNHIGTVKRLLDEKDVDVNGKDDNGRTLLSLALLNIEETTCYDFVSYLLDKGSNPNLGDTSKTGPLHILAAKIPRLDMSNNKSQVEATKELKRVQKVQNDLIDLLLSKGADLTLQNDSEKTPFEIALELGNINVLERFSKNVSLNKAPQILHVFSDRVFDQRFSEILVNLLNQERDLEMKTINVLDKHGFTPFLNFIKQFVEKLRNGEFSQKMRQLIQFNALKRGQSYSAYTMTNLLLYTCEQDPGY